MTHTTEGQPTGAQPTADDAGAGERYRRELFAHCYRMTGSVHEAEDLVQETYLRAWRSREGFQGRSSVRTWLHRIATNTCLTALEGRSRRPLPTGLGAPASDPTGPLELRTEVPWLEPAPDALVGIGTAGAADAEDPAAVAAGKESLRLAFVAALQFLTPQQRAVLLLREVLAWRAAEIADALGTSEAAVNSLLQRGRAELARVNPRPDALREPESARMREVLDRYMAAFEAYDLAGMVAVFTEDTVWEMPPYSGWYVGAETVGRLIGANCPAEAPGDMRMVPTSANGQPAFGLYMRGEDGVHRAFQLQVLTVSEDDAGRVGVSHVATFFEEGMFTSFGLPEVWDPSGKAGIS